MKHDVLKEAEKRAHEDAKGVRFTTLSEMRRFIVDRKVFWARKLYATDESHEDT